MKQTEFLLYITVVFACLLVNYVKPGVVTGLCSSTSCNCTVTDGTILNIVCSPTPNLTDLPTLSIALLQTNITELHVHSSTVGSHGPLVVLPTNICSSYPNIAILDLSFNSIGGYLNTSQLACLGSKLIKVDLSNNYINSIDLNFFQANNQLQSIDLSQNTLTTMPMINSDRFINFPSSIVYMNFSYNQITNVDFWPLFVVTRNYMEIDMSHNVITNFTNKVPIYIKQFTETPDPRQFFLNNNNISRLSDLLLEQYGACFTTSTLSTAYFIVGISYLLLTDNPIICDCESYNIIKFLNDNMGDFPQISNGSALISRATCEQPSTVKDQQYIYSTAITEDLCQNYTLPNVSDIYCSVYTNNTNSTIAPPTYWTTRTTTTPIDNVGNTTTLSSGGSNAGVLSSASAPPWYVILGIVLGLALIIFSIVLTGFIFKDRLCPNRYPDWSNDRFGLNGQMNTEQQTQTSFQIDRSKTRTAAQRDPLRNRRNIGLRSSYRLRQSSSTAAATDAATNTTNAIKGIPMLSVTNKISTMLSNGSTAVKKASTSELNVTSIPLTASKRAKVLPPVKSGIYVDVTNSNSLNTSGTALLPNPKQRRRSVTGLHKQNPAIATPVRRRPQSMIAKKSAVDNEDSPNDDVSSIRTIDNSPSKSSKPTRALPLSNTRATSAWMDNTTDQK